MKAISATNESPGWGSARRANREQQFRDCEGWAPLIFENTERNAPVTADIWMIYSRYEPKLRRFE